MKDQTEIGIAGLPIPRKRLSPKNRHEFEKKRRANLGQNVRGQKYSFDVNPYVNPRSIRESRSERIKEISLKAGDKNLDLSRTEVEKLHKKTYKEFMNSASGG
jgi:hypothetical protein